MKKLLRPFQSKPLAAAALAAVTACVPVEQPLPGVLPQPRPADAAPVADWRPRLSAVQARLDGLQRQVQLQGGAVARALGALFPAEQGHAYARLGGRTPMGSGLPRVSNNTSLKA